jgi:hypothetical protein
MGSRECHRPTGFVAFRSRVYQTNLCFCLVFRDNDKPRYVKAFIAHIVVYGVQLVTIVYLRIRLMHQNVLKRRAQSLPATKANGEDSVRGNHFFFCSSIYSSVNKSG